LKGARHFLSENINTCMKINKMPELYVIFARKNIFPNFVSGLMPPVPCPFPTPMSVPLSHLFALAAPLVGIFDAKTCRLFNTFGRMLHMAAGLLVHLSAPVCGTHKACLECGTARNTHTCSGRSAAAGRRR